jgi:hypothetical protein
LYFLRVFFVSRLDVLALVRNNVLLISLLSALAIVIFPRLGGHGGVPGELVANSLVEASVARSILYPFVFPWYGSLTDAVSVALVVMLGLMVFLALREAKNPGAKQLAYGLITATIIYAGLTLVMRPGLTGLLDNYASTFPDRYFMGINILVSLLMVLSFSQLTSSDRTRLFGAFGVASLSLLYLANSYAIVEWGESRMPLQGALSFQERMCLSESASGLALIPISPPGWTVLVPERYVKADDCRSHEELGIARADGRHELVASPPLEEARDIRLELYGFPVKRPVSRVEVMFGTYMRANPGYAQLVLDSLDGRRIEVAFALSGLADNQYEGFDLPEGIYLSGEIVSLGGVGVSTWESHDEDGRVFTCLNFRFADGSRGFTPGCPLF